MLDQAAIPNFPTHEHLNFGILIIYRTGKQYKRIHQIIRDYALPLTPRRAALSLKTSILTMLVNKVLVSGRFWSNLNPNKVFISESQKSMPMHKHNM